ncbi:MAG: formate dehydrogenase accessory sulfurtransferase FdhD [Chloroflexota bacterium]
MHIMARTNKIKRRIWTVEKQTTKNSTRRKTDFLATEEPLEIQLSAGREPYIEQKSIAITMRTPGNDYELAAGFLYNEGVVAQKRDIVQITYCLGDEPGDQEYNQLNVRLAAPTLPELAQLDRHFFVNSACGICGKMVLDELAERDLPENTHEDDGSPLVQSEIIYQLPTILRRSQNLFESTGGLHAAALFSPDGTLMALREDVGRHNALDKLIGWGLLNKQLPFTDKIIMVSGRASYELLQKCAVAGAPILCAVSAPSSLAVELAEQFDITLIGFLRDEKFNIYTGRERIGI